MAQILDPLPNNQNDSILCCYVNATNQIQVVRITNVINWYFERVVFPGQRLVFKALSDALLEIHTGMMASAILSNTIPCKRLSIDDDHEEDKSDLTILLENLTDQDVDVRSQAAISLGQLGNENAIPDLCQTLLNDPSPEVRCYAAEALGNNTYLNYWTNILENDANSQHRLEAIQALTDMNDENTVPILCKIATTDPIDEVRGCAVRALKELELERES